MAGIYNKKWQNRASNQGWTPPSDDQFQSAAQRDPTGAAAAAAYNNPSTGQTAGSPTYGRNIQSSPVDHTIQGGMNAPAGSWYGNLGQAQGSMMANDSDAFWIGYGDSQGYGAGNDLTPFLQDKYNLQNLGAAMYGKSSFSEDDTKMAGQTAIGDFISQPGLQFFDAGTLIKNTLSALQSKDPEALFNQNPMLGNLLLSTQGNPLGQVSAILGFLQETLKAAMPPDTLSAFMNQLAAMGDVWSREVLKGGDAGWANSNFASFLVQRFGPTLGL